ncbi:radical SAM protein [Candidatus Methylocalor cossyra]|uniref:Wyosine [tRNA(Phe)-imidazoG37] synthetase (Radical SAM superfamily) n=1 Tax=Candidatus Methylocalor cossyra TaxID=3108543 RepID=A0ABM9NE14_9GAMM
MPQLTVTNHSRDSAELLYVYPVLARRSGGLSIGINLNPNNACNWRCVYCQVPNLVRGRAPDIDLGRLEKELRGLLDAIRAGSFFTRFPVPEAQRVIRDIAISGNGEPTTSPALEAVMEVIGRVSAEFGGTEAVKRVLITNGSQLYRPEVRRALARWNSLDGEVWFKVDSATATGIRHINNVYLSPDTVLRHLEVCARSCRTWIQTCLFAFDGEAPSAAEQRAYLDFLAELKGRAVPLQGVLLYGVARPSQQPEAPRLSPLPKSWLLQLAERIGALGLEVRVHC